jgi:Resolvase, N terminal domain
MHIIDPMRYGYATVSTDDQSIDGQVRQLKAAGCKTVDREVPSGAKTDRAQLRRLLGQLEPGDVLMVTRLDRLARSPRDLLNTLAAITGRKAGFRSLGDTWADNHHITRAPDADRAWRPRGIRARSYSHPNRRRPRPGEGAWCEDGPQAQAYPAPASGGDQAPGQWRDADGDCTQLQRQSHDDFKAHSMFKDQVRLLTACERFSRRGYNMRLFYQ